MERRDVLRTAATAATASTVGLAGCGILGGGGCDTPGDDLTETFPDSDDYSQQNTFTSSGNQTGQENIEQFATATYTGPDDGEFSFTVVEYSDTDAAESEADNASEGGDNGSIGYIIAENYVYVGTGPDEDSITEFMSTSPTLGDCVDDNIEFI